MISILKVTGFIILIILAVAGVLIGKLAIDSIKKMFKKEENKKDIDDKTKKNNLTFELAEDLIISGSNII